jgi:hypothetical protein
MKRETGCARIPKAGAELEFGDKIIPAVLAPVGNGRDSAKRPHPLAKTIGHRCETGLVDTVGAVDPERRPHVVTGITEFSGVVL